MGPRLTQCKADLLGWPGRGRDLSAGGHHLVPACSAVFCRRQLAGEGTHSIAAVPDPAADHYRGHLSHYSLVYGLGAGMVVSVPLGWAGHVYRDLSDARDEPGQPSRGDHPDPFRSGITMSEHLGVPWLVADGRSLGVSLLEDGALHRRSGLAPLVHGRHVDQLCVPGRDSVLAVLSHPDAAGWPDRLCLLPGTDSRRSVFDARNDRARCSTT